MKLLIFVLVVFVSDNLGQQWPAHITSMNANGARLSPLANTFPINGLGQGGSFPMGQMGSYPGPQRSPFSSMQMPQMQMPIFGGSQMPGSFGGGQMQFLPVQPQRQQPSPFGGAGAGFPFQSFPSMNQQQQFGGRNPMGGFQHPRQFGQRQFQPMASFQQNSPPQEATNSVQEPAPSSQSSSSGSLPKFLEGAPEETITEFKRIIRQPNVTYDNKMKEVEKLVSDLDGVHQQLYHQFMDESDKTQQTKRDAIHKTVEGMSEDAQGQFAKISAILTNPALPEEERWNRILTIYGKLEPSLRNEFEEKFKPLV
uniref:DUF148 domain-containing protein n=1 Tax=Panagrolaimus sp. PS1159 TaxID=55785 RepID=A0AC35GUZ1_9BILA